MSENTIANHDCCASNESRERAKIGRNVVYFALLTIGILGLVSIVVACFAGDAKDRFNYVKDILAILLPVIGTWVGTVLAFYFSKENFTVAAQQASNLVKQMTSEQKLQEIAVKDVMKRMDDADVVTYLLAKQEDAVNLYTDLVDPLFVKHGKNRLPILDGRGVVIYLLHRSLVDKFISNRALAGTGKAVKDLTLKDLLEDAALKKTCTSFGTIGITEKLAAAKNKMDGNVDCADVFVTEDGTEKTKAIGWITNVIIEEKSKV